MNVDDKVANSECPSSHLSEAIKIPHKDNRNHFFHLNAGDTCSEWYIAVKFLYLDHL